MTTEDSDGYTPIRSKTKYLVNYHKKKSGCKSNVSWVTVNQSLERLENKNLVKLVNESNPSRGKSAEWKATKLGCREAKKIHEEYKNKKEELKKKYGIFK
ncbi:MAG: hypothetical protein ABEK59_11990 [Halobacteria archaeon]